MATYTTFATAEAAYLANSDWDDGAGSVSKAQAFRSACRALLVLKPSEVDTGQKSHAFDMRLVSAQLDAVQAWLAENDPDQATGGCVRYVDLRYTRS